ncbi:MAG: hypothetical protein V7K97_29040 [Nostoc sp.]|uniref:DUF6887 family protein n=1 Tax=Nostoc sp. TaxID=1180 RepID=UPI002FFCEA68
MNKPDFMSTSGIEVRKYILEHKEDEAAFQVYVDRFKSDSNQTFPVPQTIDD